MDQRRYPTDYLFRGSGVFSFSALKENSKKGWVKDEKPGINPKTFDSPSCNDPYVGKLPEVQPASACPGRD
jgi:hypothetical protein